MRRFFSFITVLCFSAWLLPLGNFIKPSQEKTVCGGDRAFHMCSMMAAKAGLNSGPSQISFTNASGADNTQKSPAAGGSEFFSEAFLRSTPDLISKFYEQDRILPSKAFYFSIDPVPKA